MRSILKKLFSGSSLSQDEATHAMKLLMENQVPPEQIGAFLGILKGKGETVDEITGFVRSMRNFSLDLSIKRTDLIETCGTGGDGSSTFNISTACTFVLAGGGLGIIKHGNRSASSQCGSADVLEALGININLSKEEIERQVDEIGFGFLFTRKFHPATKNIAPVRTSLGVRTVFNILDTLSNPASAKKQVIGVYDKNLLEKLAYVLKNLGSEEVMLVAGSDGLDEFTLSGKTYVTHLKEDNIYSYTVTPMEAGLKEASTSALKGGDASTNAEIIESILQGEKGPRRDIVLLNSAAAFMVSGKAKSINEGRKIAADVIDSKAAFNILEKLREANNG